MQNNMFNPYISMKNLFIVFLLYGSALYAANSENSPSVVNTESVQLEHTALAVQSAAVNEEIVFDLGSIFGWNLLWSGSWEESASTDFSGNLSNRLELKLTVFPVNLLIRGQILDRRVLNFAVQSFKPEEFFPNPGKDITNFTAALYHKPTGSRLLYGVLDEWGLPARIRNPWIRSPPYTGNHNVILADLKTSSSGTKEDEVYLYLSSPVFVISSNIKIRGFLSFQTNVQQFTPAVSGGADFSFGVNNLRLDLFHTGAALPPSKISTWFSDPPPLPERDFRLYAAGVIFSRPSFSVSSDFAFSETFAWGKDLYVNFGFTVTPLLPFGARERPLTISFAADGAGARFVFRDGAGNREGFRTAGKIEWKSRYNSLFRIDLTLRSPSFGENFNRSSAGIYYRFPLSARNSADIIRFTVISVSAGRNAVNSRKINDSFSGSFGLRLSLARIGIKNPFGINVAGSITGLTASENPSFFPIVDDAWALGSASISLELTWLPLIFQFRTKTEYTYNAGKDDNWEFSIYTSARFKSGRLSVKAASPDFPVKWDLTVTWRLNVNE